MEKYMHPSSSVVLARPDWADIPAIFELLRDGQVAPTTSTISNEYKMADAERWFSIATSKDDDVAIERVIRLRSTNKVVGIISCKKYLLQLATLRTGLVPNIGIKEYAHRLWHC